MKYNEKNEFEYLCDRCRYFCEFYIKRDTGFYPFRKGICRANRSFRDKRDLPFVKECADWQPKEIKIEERKNSIINFLLENAQRLNEIAQILEEDALYLKNKSNE